MPTGPEGHQPRIAAAWASQATRSAASSQLQQPSSAAARARRSCASLSAKAAARRASRRSSVAAAAVARCSRRCATKASASMASMAAPSGSSPLCGGGAVRIARTRSGQPVTACSAVRKGVAPGLASPKALASSWPSGPRIASRIPPGGGAPARAVTSSAGSARPRVRRRPAGRGCWRPALRPPRPPAPGRRPPPPGSGPTGRAAATPAAAGQPPGSAGRTPAGCRAVWPDAAPPRPAPVSAMVGWSRYSPTGRLFPSHPALCRMLLHGTLDPWAKNRCSKSRERRICVDEAGADRGRA